MSTAIEYVIKTQKQEIDYIEEKDGSLTAWEFKSNSIKSKTKCPLTFSGNYPNTPYTVITPENYLDFICNNKVLVELKRLDT